MTERPPDDHAIASRLAQIARAFEAAARTAYAELELTPGQAEALRFAATTRPDVATVGQLARVLGVRHATAVGLLRPLVERGLVERRPHPFDGRQSILAPTEEGQALAERVQELASPVDDALTPLDGKATKEAREALDAIAGALGSAGLLVEARPCAGCVHFRPESRDDEARPHYCELIRRSLGVEESTMLCPEHEAAAG